MEIQFTKFFTDELTISDLQSAMDKEEISSKQLVMYYLHQIAKYDQAGPHLHSILEINPDAIFIAEALDEERKVSRARGPLHGIPILLKDNIETKDAMHTSAGTLALQNNLANEDAFLVKQLRQAGAVILGKTNMTELANGMASEMWAGYSARGGQTVNPYGDRDLFVGGSSSGSAVAVAANFTVGAIGTETDASILSPAIQNSVVGIKPTVGLISRSGLIPFTYSQDTAGPIARTVTDAAFMLEVLVGMDKDDPATMKSKYKPRQRYSYFLQKLGLAGARIGVFTKASERYLKSEEHDELLFQDVIHTLRQQGAILIEDVDIPSFLREWSWDVSFYELKHSLDNYLFQLPSHMPLHSVNELIHFNEEFSEQTLKYGQDKLEARAKLPTALKSSEYLNAKIEDLYFSQELGMDYALQKHQLDAIVFPSYIGSTICAKAGYPSIAVPAGYMKNGRPFGVTFAGTAFSESTLIKLAYSFEQATRHRKPPTLK
ncbi:amidase family protein [Alkalihalobacillus sp. LMS39]|uniref:amidase family protein n=1 Tax=Alkalihalobacillus sp. LMS39 TaxID=2924032 RepID=UPI001FB4C5BA|nr:amidase family protein [Alkalihalobacillus sp. LMS39]UOE94709.1 amidase family protein [Alkalihalobacillus sp. LMS39]